MLVSKENSKKSDFKPQIFPLSPRVQTCVKDKECGSVLQSSRTISQTTLPILNKMPNTNTMEANFFISAAFLPIVQRDDTTVKNFNLHNLNFTKYSLKSKASCKNHTTNDTKNIIPCATQPWPLAGKRYPGFKPLEYRTRPTFGEQCLKTGNQWPSPREEPGPTLPYLDLFADDPTGDKRPVKNDAKARPVKPVSWIRKNRFPALFDSYNIRNGLFCFDEKSHTISGKTEQAMSPSVDFPEITPCMLNMVDTTKGGDNKDFPKHHIHLPSAD